jgi:hypothetical protein
VVGNAKQQKKLLIDHFQVIWFTKESSDVIIYPEGGNTINAHALILKCYSRSFRNLLSKSQKEKDGYYHIKVPSLTHHFLTCALKFIYFQECDIQESLLIADGTMIQRFLEPIGGFDIRKSSYIK